MSSRYAGFGSRQDDNESKDDFVSIGTHFDPAEPTNSTSILATLGRKASKLVDLSSSNYGYDGKRFHGAFTGGFNAGYYNSVGSVEGWRPSEFKSSRADRAEKRSYEPEDFMDKGDFSEHGINPKQIKIRDTFDQNQQLTRTTAKTPSGTVNQRTNDDILREMIRVKTLSIGKRILMSMGWKPGEGVGAKMSRKHRQKLKMSLTQETPKDLPPSSPPPPPPSEQQSSGVKVYGVALPPPSFQQTVTKVSRLDDDDDYFDDQIYANVNLPPLDYEVHFQLQKQEHHGLGYKGLESLNLFGHDNLFVQPSIEKQITNVKIRGQAFGVGIEEDEDDRDLFAVDDLKQYDYELTTPTDTTTDIMRNKAEENNFTLKFVRYEAMSMAVVYSSPALPIDYRIGHRFPKSLMPPPRPAGDATETTVNEPPKQTPMQMDANTRGLLLGDLSFLSRPPPNVTVPPPSLPPPPPPSPAAPPPKEEIIPVKTTPTPTAPAQSLEWDVEKERSSHSTPTPPVNARTQFLDAVKNRFTSSTDREHLTEQQSMEAALQSDLRKAVSMNLYGDLTRSTSEWKPNPLLCKRMNIPNPYSDDAYEDTKESKKSRRQLCSNLFEHLFTQSTESPTSAEQPLPHLMPPPSSIPTPNITVKPPPPVIPVAPKSQPAAQFAPIESFEQQTQERPPLDFFSAIFDNQDSDDENVDEQETEAKKNNDIPKSNHTQSSITLAPPVIIRSALSKSPPSPDSDLSDSSDSSIEIIETPAKRPVAYGPAIPSKLSSRPKTDNDNSLNVFDQLANSDEQFEELKIKKKHKKKKKHHKKSKKHHHQ